MLTNTGGGTASSLLTPDRIPGSNPLMKASASTVLVGGATSFTATNKTCLVAGSKFTRGAGVDFWFEIWAKFASAGTGDQLLFMDAGGGGQRGVIIYKNTSNKILVTINGDTAVTHTSTAAVVVNEWTHIVAVADRDGLLTLYLNGASDSSVSIATVAGTITSTNFPVVAANASKVSQFCDATLAHIRHGIGSSLTAAQVTALYNNKNPLPYASFTADLLTALGSTGVAWPLDEALIGDPTKVTGASLTARDLHTSANHLTFTQAEMLTNGDFSTRTGITGASLAAGDKAHLEAADNAAFNLGTGDIVGNANFLNTTSGATSIRIIASKYQDADNYWALFTSNGYVNFVGRVGGTSTVRFVCNTTQCTSTTTKYDVTFAIDRSDVNNCKIWVNGTEQSFAAATVDATSIDNTGKFFVGQLGDGTGYFDGRIAMLGIGKPADASAAAVTAALAAVAGTGGLGQYYNEQQTTPTNHRGALAWSVFYDLTEAGGTRQNFVNPGTNNLAVVAGEMIVNGSFTTDSDWTKGTGWTVDNADSNVAAVDGSQTNFSNLYQTTAMAAGRTYTVTGDVVITADYVRVYVGTSAAVDNWTTTGSKSTTRLRGADSSNLIFVAGADTIATLDNVSLKAADIPCHSDADGFGSWGEYSVKTSIETVAPYAGALAVRAEETSNGVLANLLTLGHSYSMSVYSKASSGTPNTLLQLGTGSNASVANSTSYAQKTYSGVCSGNTYVYFQAGGLNAGQSIVLDNASLVCTSLTAANGPSTAIASDSVGTNHATLTGFSAAQEVTCWGTKTPDGSYTATVDNQGSGGATYDGTMTNFADVDLARFADRPSVLSSTITHSILFDGADDAVTFGTDPAGTGAITISAWIKLNGWGEGNFGRIFDNGKATLYLDGSTGKLVLTSNAVGAASAVSSITLGSWIHVAVTRTDAGVANIYINGALSGSPDQDSGVPAASSTTPMIGNRAAGDRTFDGQICDFRIYNSVLSAASIAALTANTYTATEPIVKEIGYDVPRSIATCAGGYSMTLDGVANYLLNTVADYRSADSAGTITFWVKTTSSDALYVLGSGDTAVATYLFGVRIYNGKLEVLQRNNDTQSQITGNASVKDGAWHHCAVVSSGTAYTFYVDGVSDGTLTATTGSNDGDWFADTTGRDNVTIGALVRSTITGYFAGSIDDVRVYSAALSAAQIASLAAGTDVTTGLVSKWTMDDGVQGSPSPYSPINEWVSSDTFRTQLTQTVFLAKPYASYAKLLGALGPYFDGIDDHLYTNVPPATTLQSGSIWGMVATDGTLATDQTLLSWNDTASATRFFRVFIPANTRQLALGVRNNDTEDILTTDLSLRDTGSTFAIAGDGSTIVMWIDGKVCVLTVTAGSNTGRWIGDVSGIDNFVAGAQITSAGTSKYFKGNVYYLAVPTLVMKSGHALTLAKYALKFYGLALQ